VLIETATAPGGPVLLWPAALILWGPGSASSMHAHHCVQLVFALRGELRFRSAENVPWRRCAAVVIHPDAPHEIDANGVEVLIAFVDAESDLGAALIGRFEAPTSIVPDAMIAAWRTSLAASVSPEQVDAWARASLLGARQTPKIHPGVRRVLRHLREQLHAIDDRNGVTLDQLAAVAKLSPSRFQHAFSDSLGVSLRPYLLWLRLQRAAGALASGATATEAAHIAGFSDAAHLSRTFRRMLGTTPGAMSSRGRARGRVGL
jgi:AraC-like DNA-binding protein